jgi:hypothetical protein
MRRLWFALLAVGFLGMFMGCHTCGRCDCGDCCNGTGLCNYEPVEPGPVTNRPLPVTNGIIEKAK